MHPILGATICKDSRVATLNVESTRWGLGRLQSNECSSSSERTFESEFSDLFSISRPAPTGSVHTNAQSLLCHRRSVWEHILSHISFQFLLIRVFFTHRALSQDLESLRLHWFPNPKREHRKQQTRTSSYLPNSMGINITYFVLLPLRRSLMTTGKLIFRLFFWKSTKLLHWLLTMITHYL